MAKFNTAQAKTRQGAPNTVTSPVPDTLTHEGAWAYTRDNKSELFLAAVSSFLGDTFYESGNSISDRIRTLTENVVVQDRVWVLNFLLWLRKDAGMRSASILVAVAGAAGLLKAKIPGARQLIDAAIDRADEPGEVLAAWRGLYSKVIPSAVKRGVNDGINRVWNEYSALKYNGKNKGYSFADVMNLTHPKMDNQELGKWIMEGAYDREYVTESLNLINMRKYFDGLDNAEKRQFVLDGRVKSAGLTWEVVASVLGKPDAAVWEALLPSMGYMAKLRSLRRLEEAGVSNDVLDKLCDELANEDNVAKSRQLPLRFLSAYKQTSLRFAHPLEMAVNHSLKNVPALSGNTLILLDRSGSMTWGRLGNNSSVTWSEGADLFAAALALRAEKADLMVFSTTIAPISFRKSQSLLQVAATRTRVDGGGTDIAGALRQAYKGHDRVVILTDEQAQRRGIGDEVPGDIPIYTFNLAGYQAGFAPSGPNRYTFGGLNDQGFNTIAWVEAGKDQKYPWEMNNS